MQHSGTTSETTLLVRIVEYISNGYAQKEISDMVGLSAQQLSYLLYKGRVEAGCKSTAELVAKYLREKIIE